MTSQCRRATDDIIRTVVHPLLKAASFTRTRTRRIWNRTARGWVDVVIIQGGAYSHGPSCYFFINLGILVPEVYRLVTGREPPPPPIHDSWCTVQVRARDPIAPPGVDQYWNFDAAGNLDAFRARLRQALATGALPFFARLQTLQDLHDLRTEPPWYPAIPPADRAVINALRGDVAGAKEVLEELYRSYRAGIDLVQGTAQATALSSYQHAQERVRRLAAQIGVALDGAHEAPTTMPNG